MTASWPDWLRRTGFAAPSNWLGCGRRLEWRHLTEQHIEGCMNRVSLPYTSCKTFAQWQTTTEAAEVVQREERRKTTEQWSSVMFSDESKFVISFGKKGPRVWRKKGERNTDGCLKRNVKFPQSVMVWGAMSSAGVSDLCFLKSSVNAAVYQDILEYPRIFHGASCRSTLWR